MTVPSENSAVFGYCKLATKKLMQFFLGTFLFFLPVPNTLAAREAMYVVTWM